MIQRKRLQKLIDIVYSYCSNGDFVSKSAVIIFSKGAVNGCWKWESIAFQKCILIVT